MSLIKKITAAVMAFVLVLCTGYFSTMSPTTAWSFQSQNVSGTENTFVFADFDVDGEYYVTSPIKFKGATRFENGEDPLFDSVVDITEIHVTNEGGMPARIYATVENEYETKGLHYFYFTDEIMVDNSVKATMTQALGGKLTEEALKIHNVGEDGNSGYYIMLNPGETKTVKVAMWIEYDDSGMETAFNESAWETLSYRIKTTLTATQDTDGALVR